VVWTDGPGLGDCLSPTPVSLHNRDMTTHPLRRVVVGVLAAIAVVFGGSFAA
jgi:hypothetical protein